MNKKASTMLCATAAEMREMDRRTIEEFGIPGCVLMETAARGAFDFLRRLLPDLASKCVAVAAGRGNNGGDGFVMARLLAQMGGEAVVYLLAKKDDISGDAALNLALLPKMGVPVIEIADSEALSRLSEPMRLHDVWIDAILGTGLSSPVRGLYRQMIEFINAQKKFVFSVDVPSGLFSDTGAADICIKADATATFALPKVGLWAPPGASLRGALEVIDIGIPQFVMEAVAPRHFLVDGAQVKSIVRPRKPEAHKGDSGRVLVVAGSRGKTGAACLAAHAALRAGAGLVTLAGSECLKSVFEMRVTEAMTCGLSQTTDGFVSEKAVDEVLALVQGWQALALGPGLGTHPETMRFVNRVVAQSPVPVVADADALNALALDPAVLKSAKSPVILTPHPGEMARLSGLSTGEIQKDRIGAARRFATEFGVVLILKGAKTIVSLPDGKCGIISSGNPGMASGGMGDALTGIIAGLLAQGYAPQDCACVGAYLHGLCADILAEEKGPVGFLASEVADALPLAFKKILG